MTTQQDEWLTIREAAHAIGASELTIRRRIKDGRLAHRFEHGKYYVNLGAPEPAQGSTTSDQGSVNADRGDTTSIEIDADRSRLEAINLSSLLANYSRLAETAGRASAMEGMLREVQTRNDELQESLMALVSRNGWLESKLDEREREIKLLSDTRRRVPWWRRMFGLIPAES